MIIVVSDTVIDTYSACTRYSAAMFEHYDSILTRTICSSYQDYLQRISKINNDYLGDK